MRLTDETAKPTWSELFRPERDSAPSWYRDQLIDEEREFWDAEMGDGFYDWYLAEIIEGAKEPESDCDSPPQPPQPPQPVQLYFAGMSPEHSVHYS